MRQRIAVYFGLLVLLCASGCCCCCAHRAKINVTRSSALDYEQLHVVYEVSPKTGLIRLNEPAAVQQTGMTVPHDQDQPAVNSRIRLDVQYPFPGVHPAFARATLRVIPEKNKSGSKAKASAKNSPEEILEIDFPKTDLDGLLYDLANDGYFADTVPKSVQCHLDVTCNKGRVKKDWSREPRLENLIDILKRHGTPAVAKKAS